ncbi:MOSC domain-containing protein [Halolamina litorea]|uniref:MOSC domain-containing protein n=1 Tax=Halolamina litorea TaxID=1515593 RepID=A0ABD6BMM0_9EURY|nr:MOSC N-terminal beta barrel domain-containing protein [Halolamina litorea]
MARLEGIRLYPVKGLAGADVDAATVLDSGVLAGDREFALFDAMAVAEADPGEIENGSPHANGVFNAKHSERFHELDSEYDPETATLRVETADGERDSFDLDADRETAAAWFSAFFDRDLVLLRDTDRSFVDRRGAGPSVVSTATLEAVASWFEGMSVENARRRLRANVEISGVPAFWEDQFVGDDAPAFEAGDVRFEGVTPCVRCVVPERDPETGEPTPEFRKRFVEKREATFPEFADRDAFEQFYTLMLIADVPEEYREQSIRVGDPVSVVD